MERRFPGFVSRRSQHYDNQIQQADSPQKQPLKDATNTGLLAKQQKLNNNEISESRQQEPESTQQQNGVSNASTQQGSRSLQCLETLAQKAGITVDDCKYDIANTLLNLDRGNAKLDFTETQNENMTELKPQQQVISLQMVDQAQAQAQVQVQTQQVVQQQAMQLQEQQQAMVPAQSPQHLQQVAVVSSGGQCVQVPSSMGPPQQTVSVSMQQQPQGQVLQQSGQVLAPVQTTSTTITTMSPLQQGQPQHQQQISTADWGHGRVQVIQQPIQNPTYLQQLYNTNGQLIMPSNIALHPSINPQQIQVIQTKPFQGNQLAPHMLTAQGKQVLQASQAASFPGYTTIPTIPTTQNQQTLVFSQLGVISSQPNILPSHSAAGTTLSQQKPQEMHKVMGQKVMQKVTGNGQTVTAQQQGQCVQVSQAMLGSQPTAQIISPLQPGGQMQFAPWQFTNGIPQVSQVWTTNGLQPGLLAPNPIIFRGTQPDGTPGMFIQHSPQATATAIQTQHNTTLNAQGTVQQMSAKPRPAIENIQPKQPTTRPLSNILPSNVANIRQSNALNVSTQTGGQIQQQMMGIKPGSKVRTKITTGVRTSPAPKSDAANQTQIKTHMAQQQQLVAGKQMVVMNTTGMTPGSPMTTEKAQQLAAQANKAVTLQQQQQQQHQQQQQQQQVLMQQQALQQQASITAAMQLQFQQQQPHHIQPKPMLTMQTIQGMPQQQIQVTGERPIMPVASMSAQGTQMQPTLHQTIPQMSQTLPLQPNLAVTQQPVQMSMQQIHPQLTSMAPGTIIGQIQTAPQTGTISQVSAQQQITQNVPLPPQPLTLQSPQQAPVASTTPMKEECSAADASTPISAVAPMDTKEQVEVPSQSESKEQTSELNTGVTNGVDTIGGLQPAPIPGTVPTQPQAMTASENGIPIGATAEEIKEKNPPKALVKPQVLTHVIEDFVIQESSEPFPVTRSSLMADIKSNSNHSQNAEKETADEPARKRHAGANNFAAVPPRGELAKCEACGTIDLRAKFKKNKRFCSVSCSKSQKYKSNDLPKKGKWNGKDESMEVEVESGASGAESSLSPNDQNNQDTEDSSSDVAQPKVNPLKWTVTEVCDFIRNLDGCAEYAEDFAIQEIDGQALMLLKEDHLMTAMAMKLGPALKIVSNINAIRLDKEQPKQ